MANGVPPTGLIGAEAGLREGLMASLSGIDRGLATGRADLTGQTQQGINALQNSLGQVTNTANQAITGLGQTQQQGLGRIDTGIAGLDAAQQQGLGAISQAIGQGVSPLQGFIDPGMQAQQRQAALSGALGADAQAQAFQGFQDSPGQAFLRERGEQAVLRNAAATGGLGGGRVLQELQRQGIGLAAQDFQNQFDRLGLLSGQGLSAAGQVGQLRGQEAGLSSGLIGDLARSRGQLQGQGADLISRIGQAQANVRRDLGQAQFQTGRDILGARENLGRALSNAEMQGRLAGSDIASRIAQVGAANRLRAGEGIASAIGSTASNLANLLNRQGAGSADIIGGGAGNIANLLTGLGSQDAASREQLAALLSNIQLGQAGQVSSLPGLGQFAGGGNTANNISQAAGGLGTILKLFDQPAQNPAVTDSTLALNTAGGFNVPANVG